MFWRNMSSFICIFVTVVVATVHNDSHYTTGPHPEDTVYRLTTENPEAPLVEPIQEVKETSAVDLGDLLDAGDGAMTTLVVGDTRLLAHRAVLVARSPVFASALRHIPLEASSSQVEIPDVEGPVLRHLLAHMYTLQAPQLPSMAPQLLAAADKYGLSLLKAECERQVAAQLSVETAATTAVLALRHSSDFLKQAAIPYIKENLVQVMFTQGWEDMIRSQPENLIQVIRLLSASAAETSPPPPATGDSRVAPTSLPLSNHSHTGEGPAAASAAPPTAHDVTPTPDGADVSLSHAPAPADSGTTHATLPHSDRSSHSDQTPATAAPATAAHTTEQPEDPAVSLLRNLSGEQKNMRLIEAAKVGAQKELLSLLTAGADVGATGEYGMTALHWAAHRGHVEAVRSLLEAGANVHARNGGQWTPLHCAAEGGNEAVVRLLVESSADPNARGDNGWTPLHWAASKGNERAARTLIDAGADRSARNDSGDTPLDLARKSNMQQLVDMLT